MSWTTPTALDHVTSPWDMARRHPVTEIVQPHWGTDYRAPTGTPIRAASAGTVVRSVYDSRAGNYVRIDHGGGVWTGYSHLSQRLVVVGQRVTAGQTIGLAGSTGSATAAHLHFEVSVGGVKRDPVPWLASHITPVANPLPAPGLVPNAPGAPTLPAPLTPLSEEDDMKDKIIAVYVLLLGRMPDATGLADHLYEMAMGRRTLADVEAAIRGSAEFQSLDPAERVRKRLTLPVW